MEYYTSVVRYGNNILYRGYKDGKRVSFKEEFCPTFYVQSTKESDWHDIYGKPVEPVYPGTMRDCKEFLEKYKDVSNFSVYGNKNYVSQFLHQKFPDEIEWEVPPGLFWDIETLPTEYGYSEAHVAEGVISALAFVDNAGNPFTFSFIDYEEKSELLKKYNVPRTTKFVYKNERDMLMGCMNWLVSYDASWFCGWNSVAYDMVYFLTRITKILGEDTAARLSPWKKIQLRSREENGQTKYEYIVYGVQQLDYMLLFKKFGMKFGPQESY